MKLAARLPEWVKDAVGRPLGLRDVKPSQQWQRVVMNREIDRFVSSLDRARLDAVEVSGTERAHHPWRSFTSLEYPEFDLCGEQVDIERTYDVVICEQVLEHVVDPALALTRLGELAAPGGHVVVGTPFLIRVHAGPGDYWRFTEDGLRLMVERAGLEVVESGAWGNRRCVRANLRRWAKVRRWSSLRNDPRFPVAVWVIAKRAGSVDVG